jgi:ABC-type bacteriocin/lantibiotic exporter with double-glycine peptidase domain
MRVRLPPGALLTSKMRFQRDAYSCGIFAIMNALRAVGVKVSEKRVRAHSATTEEHGTNEHGVLNALERIGFKSEEIRATGKNEAWKKLSESLESGRPVILSVDSDRHWVAAVGLCGDFVVVFDSQRTQKVKDENGSIVYGKKNLLRRWSCKGDRFFGISVIK